MRAEKWWRKSRRVRDVRGVSEKREMGCPRVDFCAAKAAVSEKDGRGVVEGVWSISGMELKRPGSTGEEGVGYEW